MENEGENTDGQRQGSLMRGTVPEKGDGQGRCALEVILLSPYQKE
jgi:hypothetical protein